ncbi:hypothetical protein [Absidia glauca]|uniref:Ndc10 domain-containing protein n=1 Tax=Absidia glauca TaxID=4829 RepID=A0A168M1S4_ABSGL|nr:hypothetical protein [Absidia glauca]
MTLHLPLLSLTSFFGFCNVVQSPNFNVGGQCRQRLCGGGTLLLASMHSLARPAIQNLGQSTIRKRVPLFNGVNDSILLYKSTGGTSTSRRKGYDYLEKKNCQEAVSKMCLVKGKSV